MSMSTDSETAYLLVMSGVHHGARLALQPDALLVVGSGDDCDVCLSDPELEARHFALSLHDEQVTVRRLDGDVVVNGTDFDSAYTLSVREGALLELQPGRIQLRIASEADRHNFVITNADCSDTESWQRLQTPKRNRLAVAAALTCGILIATLLIAMQHNAQDQSLPVAPQIALQTLIDELNLTDEVAIDESANTLMVRGTLPADDLNSLQKKLHASPLTPTLRISTAEQLLEHVRGVFRTNGYTAKLSYGGNATVVVENLDEDSAEIQKIAAFVRSDVANLKALVFTPSEAPESGGTDSAVYLAGAGKRLTTIVDGETAYITTEDGARYFVGSTLPGGHYVRQITAQGVQVNHGDTISWLQF